MLCCENMSRDLDRTCEMHERYECPDSVIHHDDRGVYGISIKDGGDSFYVIAFCPWCGTSLLTEDNDIDINDAGKRMIDPR